MNKVYIDLDAFFWKAFNNLRLLNLKSFFENIKKKTEADEIFVFADFSSKEYLKNVLEETKAYKDELNIKFFDAYSDFEKRNFTDIFLINHFYQDFINQSRADENKYSFLVTDTRYLTTITFAQKISKQTINIFVSNDLPYYDRLNEEFNVMDIIDLNPENKTVFDKTVINEIVNIVSSSQKNEHYLTFKNIVEKCVKYSKIKNNDAMFMLHALISQKYLSKKILSFDNSDITYKVITIDDFDRISELCDC